MHLFYFTKHNLIMSLRINFCRPFFLLHMYSLTTLINYTMIVRNKMLTSYCVKCYVLWTHV